MWTAAQQDRLALEHQILQREGFTQFGVYHNRTYDSYSASGMATSSSGRRYHLFSTIPSGFPSQRPPLYVTEPNPLLMFDGTPMSRLGVQHATHTLTPHSAGWVQICHWRDNRWNSSIVLQRVFLKALLWLEAYEQHLATGRDLAEFVRTMQEAA
jgi:hypothetical protein